MDVHTGDKAYINELVLNTLIEHTLYTIKQAMMFMTDPAQDRLVRTLSDHAIAVQAARMKKPNTNTTKGE